MPTSESERIPKLRKRLAEHEADALFSLSPPDNQYLTGFTGSTSGVIVTNDEALFLCDFRYTEQARKQVADCRVEEVKGDFVARLGERLAALVVKTAAFDPAALTVAQQMAVKNRFSGTLKPVPDAVAALRAVKTKDEIRRIRAASRLAEDVLTLLIEEIKPGIAEEELAAWFEYEFKCRGAEGASFDTIALFGARSSMPHGRPGSRRLRAGDIVLLDLGCRKAGYCSDLTRTFVFGRIPAPWFKEIYQITLAAQRAALEAVRPGARCRDVDAVARNIIDKAGYGKYFGHGLGHGVGIEIHEGPRLCAEADGVLEEGTVVTIEPGIYVPGRGGARIEDLVAVTKRGCEVLTVTPKELRVLAG